MKPRLFVLPRRVRKQFFVRKRSIWIGTSTICFSMAPQMMAETYTGNQSTGINPGSPPVITAEVFNISGEIAPATGNAGIRLWNGRAENVRIETAQTGPRFTIRTNGTDAIGIVAGSLGVPSVPSPDPFLDIPIPTSQSVPGGVVNVENNANIVTSGQRGHGILAQSSTTGFRQEVSDQLRAFIDQNKATAFTPVVSGVRNRDGSAGTVGSAVTASLVDADGNVIAGSAGQVTLNANGTFSFNPGSDFGSLAVGQSVRIRVDYTVTLTNTGKPGNPTQANNGFMVLSVTKTGASAFGTPVLVGSNFSQFGSSVTAFPNLRGYVESLLSTASSGGAGNSVTVENTGSIQTNGLDSHGILAISQGSRGGNGRDASITDSSTQGGNGSMGGLVTVTANGSITTSQNQSAGVMAWSLGGDGGSGGDSGYTRNGKRGGAGAQGGNVFVYGGGTITTSGVQSSGILAVSQGGTGGNGGSGSTFNSADDGGNGGRGGSVTVDGSWNITTNGNQAHGIWAKSTGGTAGSGGSGGWTGTSAGGGGLGTPGGNVSIVSDGRIETWGNDAYGLYAESIGGFGGHGGGSGSIFFSSGGNGESAGSGGSVSATNGGIVLTHGERSHGIFAQSVGGGGGSGGGGVALVGIGGSGSTGGDGGTASGINNGTVTTTGAGSKGVYVQSIGGGGGDGGNAGGLAAVGGKGSATSAGGNATLANDGTVNSTSNALFVQSVGGGGGNGGSSAGWFAVGGAGGGGGNGGNVTLSSHGNLTTSEDNASAIFAQSIGGGGGNGGNSIAAGAVGSVAIGGKGASGGDAGDVKVGFNTTTDVIDPVTGRIQTLGDFSRGIQAQSVGGGGGNGGFAASIAVNPAGGSIGIGLGGDGGGGGDAGDVEVYAGDADTIISTGGQDAHGIFAQSIGGGGGSGGFSIVASGGVGFSGSLSFGGKGGAGSDAGNVTVGSEMQRILGTITTEGMHSYGIFAQSVGGGGGDGGFSIAAAAGAIGGSLSFGGGAGSGGLGRDVDLFSGANVTTNGVDSHAIFAQSVGGGGGSGGFSVAGSIGVGTVNVGFGGKGGAGGAAGNVVLNSSGDLILTEKDRSSGLVAQSIGGGGGDGGFAISGGISAAPSVTFAMGGDGGTGSTGGFVDLVNSSNILTKGNDSHAILAQSVGGGGGNGGFSIGASISVDPTGSGAGASVNAAIGGTGGSGGHGQKVTVANTGEEIETRGQRSYGVLAQSVGGGGGNGGFAIAGGISTGPAVSFGMGGSGSAGGNGGIVELDSDGDITTRGLDSHGILAQSVGGGGGNGGFAIAGSISTNSASVSAAVGGSGSSGGDANEVTVGKNAYVTGEIVTLEDNSFGIAAQSVGGGGGNGGFAIAGGVSAQAAINFALGGSGGAGGKGMTARLNSDARVETYGENSHAIFAQSVGGGGGNGGFSVTLGVSSQSAQVGASIGGGGDAGGNAGQVIVNSTGDLIFTGGRRSDGIHAQSIGGGGGDGGFSFAGGVGKSTAANFSIGGSGDSGGLAELVDVTNSSDIITSGELSNGIFAQSVGGGGGSGGFALAGTVSAEGNGMSFAMGGSGSAGGLGGVVKVNNSGDITTGGENGDGKGSHGIFAQSVGGGGGSGGFSGAFTANLNSTTGNALGVSIGGSGDDGGSASTVDLINSGIIQTLADDSVGLFAQSIGGGGGNGGFSMAATLSAAAEKTALSVSIGGKGSGGGNGSIVTVNNSNIILTAGNNSQGIFAQSVGGGGGNGGFSIVANGSSGKQSNSVGVSVGGAGSTGGNGQRVTVTNTGSIGTIGDDSSAIQAQSLGGGGGNGGFSITGSFAGPESKTLAVSVGGNGGAGGEGGVVEVLGNNPDIILSTEGDRSHGVFAQSIGGGGGNGGFSAAIALGAGGDDANKPSTSVAISVGGDGGTGNIGGNVFVGKANDVFNGDIVTTGEESAGIFAQSVGGGGGTGGYSIAGSANLATAVEGPNNNVAISVGGGGGSGNHGGNVSVHHDGNVETDGDGSHGIQAQSIGGGGGNGGSSRAFTLQLGRPLTDEEKEKAAKNKAMSLAIGGDGAGGGSGGIVTVVNTGNILTTGADAHGIFAQSIGGGGGTGGDAHQGLPGTMALKRYDRAKFTKNLKIVLGGSGGSSGDGQKVDVTHTGNITTTGAGSHGIFAQSIGGGGGAGGAGAVGALGSIGIGGGTGTTGNGGEIIINLTGNINTWEAGADGINAQSIGGGGGRAGNVDRGLKNYLNLGLNLGFGQGGGNAGDGGDITITTNGNIITRGTGSNGIFAQSVGGGGGVAGELGNDLPVLNITSFAGSTGGDGSGGEISIDHTGDIGTLGDASDGIWAQSAGGKDNGGPVGIKITGDIITSGMESNAIFAQSRGDASDGDITVEIVEGLIQGGKNTGAGVRFLDGNNNLLLNGGTIQAYGLMLGTAISGGDGNETVDNSGVVNGNVHLGAGTNTFIHKTGAVLQSGATIDLGAGNDFRNQGRISAGGIDNIQTTTLTGDIVQTGDAIWDFDFTADFTADRFDIHGTASLGSHFNRINLNQLDAPDSVGTYTLITADSGLTGNFGFGTFTGGFLPAGFTFSLINSNTSLVLDFAVSTGDFYWRGAAGNLWNGPFVDGESNWTRTGTAEDFIFGTPGEFVDVFFSNASAENLDTVLGTDFSANSVTFDDADDVSIHGENTLTLVAADGVGIVVTAASGEVLITADLELGADQEWLNNGTNGLYVTGGTIGGEGSDLTVDGSGFTWLDSILETGAGSLTKEGTGTLMLSQENTFTGGTTISNGRLDAANNLSLGTGDVSLNYGILRTINDPALAANTPLHLQIAGNYAQLEPTELQLRIIGPSGVSDRLVIDGTATLDGAFRPDYGALGYDPVPPAGDYTDEFHVLHANGGIAGTFSAFIDPFYNPDRLLRWEPVYEGNDVYLLWNQHPFTAIDGLTSNQRSTGDVLNRAMGIVPAIPTPYNDSTGAALDAHPTLRPAITYLNNRSLSDLPVDYDLIAPEDLTSLFDAGRAFTDVEVANVGNRLREIRAGGGSGFSSRGFSVQKKPVSLLGDMPVEKHRGTAKDSILTPSDDNPWGVFIAGSAESIDVGNDGNAHGFDIESGGITLGIDCKITENAAIGFFQQYANSDVDLTDDGRIDMDSVKFGFYGTLHNKSGFYMDALVAAGLSDYNTHRAGLNGFANGDTDGWDFDAMIGGGYEKRIGDLTLNPFATLTYSRQQIDRFEETGSMLPLIVEDQAQDSLSSRVGIEISYQRAIGGVTFTPSLSVAWQHEFLRDNYELTSRLAGAPQNGFTVSGPGIGRDSLDLRAGLDVRWNENFSTYISYQCELARTNYKVDSVTLGFNVEF